MFASVARTGELDSRRTVYSVVSLKTLKADAQGRYERERLERLKTQEKQMDVGKRDKE